MSRCYKCGDVGHMQRDCPDNCYESRSCYQCGEEGHLKSDCPDNYSHESRRCYQCGEEGHLKRDCPDLFSSESRSCYQCGEEGHLKRDCPDVICEICHSTGHMTVDCWDDIFEGNSLLLNYTSPPPPSFAVATPPLTTAVATPPLTTAVATPPLTTAVATPPLTMAVGTPPLSIAVATPPPSFAVATPPLTTAGLPPPLTTAVVPPPSSNAHRIPTHWKISSQYTSFEAAVTGLWNEKLKFKMFRVDAEEQAEIEQLLRATWKQDVVGIGADARNLGHDSIQVEKVERVENPEMYESYSERKQKLLRRLHAFTPVGRLPGSTGPVLTAEKMDNCSILQRNIDPKINEYYLFHGTKKDLVNNIARDGMDNRVGSQNALLGPGLYTAESCTKADQYTDVRTSRSSGRHRMFLVRVLLGEVYVSSIKDPPKFKRPPCQNCQQITCNCPHAQQFDSVMDSYHRRLFREFVVYERCQCYPEYLITYRRVGGTPSSSSVTDEY